VTVLTALGFALSLTLSNLLVLRKPGEPADETPHHHVSKPPSSAATGRPTDQAIAKNDAIVAVFARHGGAEAAILKLAESGLDKHFSIVGKG
jgi:hypothetical protein